MSQATLLELAGDVVFVAADLLILAVVAAIWNRARRHELRSMRGKQGSVSR